MPRTRSHHRGTRKVKWGIRHIALFALTAALAVTAAACASDTPTATSSPSAAKATAFALDEWTVVPPAGTISSGQVSLTVTNNGKETHELVIVRAADASALPKKADGSIDEDKIPAANKVGEFGDVAAGETKIKTLDLPAGDYIAFCNLVETMGKGDMGSGTMDHGSSMGEGSGMSSNEMQHVHFTLGMVNSFTVS